MIIGQRAKEIVWPPIRQTLTRCQVLSDMRVIILTSKHKYFVGKNSTEGFTITRGIRNRYVSR